MVNMMAKEKAGRHLDAKGKGEWDYDYLNDILMFKVKGREYDRSIEAENLVVDVDKEGFIVGLQIFEASDFFRVPKDALRSVKNWVLEATVARNRMEVRLGFQMLQRNKKIESILRDTLSEPLPNTQMVSTAVA